MGIRESLLNTITSVSSSDFVRIVTAAGASSKATVANLFKSFESGLGSKDSLSNSDYIRVVGSDNEAYKQSVSSLGLGSALANGTDLNTLTLPANDRRIKIYYGENISAMTNAPSAITSAWPFCLVLIPIGQGGTYTKQILHIYSPATADVNNAYIRAQTYSGGLTIWTNWVKEPTREEVDALKIKKSSKVYTGLTIAANNYVKIDTYADLGIYRDSIVGYLYTSGNYPVVLQFASDGVYLLSSAAVSNRPFTFTYLYI